MTDQAQKRNLHQRIQAVQGEIGRVPATGKNQFKSPAVSIEDVENELRPHLARYGIITRWTFEENGLQALSDGKLWMVRLLIEVVNADDPTDSWTDRWYDIGTTPLAATSFAVKGYYKRLFHIASAEDESGPRAQATGRRDEQRPPSSPQAGTQRSNGAGQAQQGRNTPAENGAPGQGHKSSLQVTFEQIVGLKGSGVDWRTAALTGARVLGMKIGAVDELDAPKARQLLAWGQTQLKHLRQNPELADPRFVARIAGGDTETTPDDSHTASDETGDFEEFQ